MTAILTTFCTIHKDKIWGNLYKYRYAWYDMYDSLRYQRIKESNFYYKIYAFQTII